jgi:metal-responsive CopG/Arc/MetJ family transcriptional regulator
MKTIQMTIDEPFLAEVDQMIQTLNTTRSAFVRQALELALQRHAITEMRENTPRAMPAILSNLACLTVRSPGRGNVCSVLYAVCTVPR